MIGVDLSCDRLSPAWADCGEDGSSLFPRALLPSFHCAAPEVALRRIPTQSNSPSLKEMGREVLYSDPFFPPMFRAILFTLFEIFPLG